MKMQIYFNDQCLACEMTPPSSRDFESHDQVEFSLKWGFYIVAAVMEQTEHRVSLNLL